MRQASGRLRLAGWKLWHCAHKAPTCDIPLQLCRTNARCRCRRCAMTIIDMQWSLERLCQLKVLWQASVQRKGQSSPDASRASGSFPKPSISDSRIDAMTPSQSRLSRPPLNMFVLQIALAIVLPHPNGWKNVPSATRTSRSRNCADGSCDLNSNPRQMPLPFPTNAILVSNRTALGIRTCKDVSGRSR